MNDKQMFMKLLQRAKRQLMLEHSAKHIQFLLFFMSAYLLIIVAMARFVIFPYMVTYIISGFSLIIIVMVHRAWRSLPGNKQAARLFDRYAGEERALSALTFLDFNDNIYKLQRHDAIRFMKKSTGQLLQRRKKLLYPVSLLASVACLSLSVVLILYPNKQMILAKKLQAEQKVVKEMKTKLQEKYSDEENERVKKQIATLMEQLKQAKNMDEAMEAIDKANNEVDLKQMQAEKQRKMMMEAIDPLNDGNLKAFAEAVTNNHFSQAKKALHQLQERLTNLTDEEKAALSSILNRQDDFTQEHLAELTDLLEEMMQRMDENDDVQQFMAQYQLELQELMESYSLNPSSELAQNQGKNPQASSTDQKQNVDTESQPLAKSDPSLPNTSAIEQGVGKNASNGNSRSSSQGNSQGSGRGVGTGEGNGQGAGIGSASRDLTIPETVDGQLNIEKDMGNIGKGAPSQIMEADGLVLKGSIRPYQEVYRQYEQAARESTERMKLPSELEDVVKGYFIKIKPK